ncbi:GntR family transcriptional regulator [Caldicellulosiruptoraceae bacterium PP1]
MKFEKLNLDDRYSPLHEKVFDVVKEKILMGLLKPGDSLIETKLSEELGVSRTPIREAIRQLELEGLVYTIPHKGAIVAGVTAQDIEDIYTIRMLLDGLAARWAAIKITKDEEDELAEIFTLMELYTQRKDIAKVMKTDSRFHELIYKASKSKVLEHVLSTFHGYILRARTTSFETPGRLETALEEHRQIYNAIIERNPDNAELFMRQHVQKAAENLIAQKKKEQTK